MSGWNRKRPHIGGVGMEEKKNPVQRKNTLAEMVEKNFEDEGSKILFGVTADRREGTEELGGVPVEGLLLEK